MSKNSVIKVNENMLSEKELELWVVTKNIVNFNGTSIHLGLFCA